MVSKEQRRHELARAKLVRQQARREAEARRRKWTAIIAAAVATLVVIGGITYLALDNGVEDPVAGETTASPTPSDTAGGGRNACRYRESGEAAKAVDRPANGRPQRLNSATASIVLDQGTIEVQLDPTAAPCTVQSFVHLAQAGYFDGTICHRLTTSDTLKVLQCGDPSGTGSGGPGYEFDDEVSEDLTYGRGVVAMANSGPNTNGSQFFLVYGDSQLPPDYTVFGEITTGLEVLDAIAAAGVEGGSTDGAPATPVTITSVAAITDPPLQTEPPATPGDTTAPVETGSTPAATGTTP